MYGPYEGETSLGPLDPLGNFALWILYTFECATNYPLVRITNLATQHVFYSRTHDHSSMAVANRNLSSTHFDVPTTQEKGPSLLEVVANGIPSIPALVFVE
ncbi:MAG: hypothetical protein ACLPH3_04830 [Terracidiphilus sp.]